MYGTIWRYGRVAESPEDVTRAGHELAVVLGQAPGFLACAVLDADDGGGASVGLFERRADLDEADGEGVMPLAHARRWGFGAIVALLQPAEGRSAPSPAILEAPAPAGRAAGSLHSGHLWEARVRRRSSGLLIDVMRCTALAAAPRGPGVPSRRP